MPISAVPITVPGKSFVGSYTPEGGLLPPIFEPQYDVGSPSGVINLFGSADAPDICGAYTNPGECIDSFLRDRCKSNGTDVPDCTPSTDSTSLVIDVVDKAD